MAAARALAIVDTDVRHKPLSCPSCGGVTPLLTLDQVGEVLKVGRTVAYELTTSGAIPFVTSQHFRGRRVRADALQAFIDDCEPARQRGAPDKRRVPLTANRTP
jgi:excisionase family DNA binding protein